MKSIRPEVDATIITVAEHQQDEGFIPIEAALVRHSGYSADDAAMSDPHGRPINTHLLAFRPSDEERARIAAGADIYVSLLTGAGPMQGIIVMAGKEEASAIYNVVPVDGERAGK